MTTEEQKKVGMICNTCGTEFAKEHGEPVLCFRCHRQARTSSAQPQLKMAWQEIK